MSDKLPTHDENNHHHRQHSAYADQGMMSKERKATARNDADPDRKDQKNQQQSAKGRAASTNDRKDLGLPKNPAMAAIPDFSASPDKKQDPSIVSPAMTQGTSLPYRSKDHEQDGKPRLVKKKINTPAVAREGRPGSPPYHRDGENSSEVGQRAYVKAPMIPQIVDSVDRPAKHDLSRQRRGAHSGPSNPERKVSAIPSVAAATAARNEASKVEPMIMNTDIVPSRKSHEEEDNMAKVTEEDKNIAKMKIARHSILAYLRLKSWVAKVDDIVQFYALCDNECKGKEKRELNRSLLY